MTPEREVLSGLLDQLGRVSRGCEEDLTALGDPPATLDAFEAMPPTARTASRALLKGFEQYVDTVQRAIRAQLRATGVRLKGLTPVDVANKAEEFEQVADAQRFIRLIDLRNELTHEYPDDAATRFARFSQALAALPFLNDVAERVRRFAATRMSGPLP